MMLKYIFYYNTFIFHSQKFTKQLSFIEKQYEINAFLQYIVTKNTGTPKDYVSELSLKYILVH